MSKDLDPRLIAQIESCIPDNFIRETEHLHHLFTQVEACIPADFGETQETIAVLDSPETLAVRDAVTHSFFENIRILVHTIRNIGRAFATPL